MWPPLQNDGPPQQASQDTWMHASRGNSLVQGQLGGAAPAASEGEAGAPSFADPLASANLIPRPGLDPKQAALIAQGPPTGTASADDAALLNAQRRALLQLRQQVAAAAAQKQLLQAQQQASEGAAWEAREQQLGQPSAAAAQQQQQADVPGRDAQPPALGQPALQAALLKRQVRARLLQEQQQVQQLQQAGQQEQQADAIMGPVLEVDSDLLEKECERVVSALGGGHAERAWALNALCVLSYQQDLRLSSTPGLLAALLPVLQEGLAASVGLGADSGSSAGSSVDEQRAQQGLPPLPGWQRRRAERACAGVFPDHDRLERRLQEAAAVAVVLRNAAEVQQNAALLLDPPVMRCWTWALDAARELVQQEVGGGDGGDSGRGLVVACGGAAGDICTSLLQMVVVLSGRMLLPAFFECGMLLLRSLLILLRPAWQYSAAAAGRAVLPPPLVSLATLAVTAVATAYQPNTDILLSMTSSPGGGQPGATLMQVAADLLICPFDVFRQHMQLQVDEESPGWRLLLPTDAELLAEGRRSSRAGGLAGAPAGGGSALAGTDARSAAALCTLDMMAVLSQLRYLSALLHLLWRLLTATGPAGAHARGAAAGCPRLLSTLCEIAVHRWPQHPARWHADGHAPRAADAWPAYLRFLSHDMMPAMRERQELLQPLRADAAALLALLAADPQTRHSVAWCEGQLVTAVMLGVVPATEPGISALLARFAAQGSTGGASGSRGGTVGQPADTGTATQ